MAVANPTSADEYTPLPLAGVVADLLPPIELYLPAIPQAKPVLYRARTSPVNERDLHSLTSRGVYELWVSMAEQETLVEFLNTNLATLLANEAQAPSARARLLNQVVSNSLKESIDCDDPAASVVDTQDLYGVFSRWKSKRFFPGFTSAVNPLVSALL